MNNCDTQATWKYHDGTKHSYWSIRNNPHFLDWANRPQPFKNYPKIQPLPLPPGRAAYRGGRTLRDLRASALIAGRFWSLTFKIWRAFSISRRGFTKQRAHPGGEIYFRAAACTGAIYEIELYVVTGDLAGLDAGVYHFNPADVSLRLLRKGDFRRNLER